MPALSPVCGSVARGVVPFVGGVGVLRRCMIGWRVRGSRGGQIAIQLLADSAALLGRGETLPVLILGGTGIYAGARGHGTIQKPNQTDANFVLNVVSPY